MMINDQNPTSLFLKALRYRNAIGFTFTLLGILFIDLMLAPQLPFWFHPIVIGVIAGIFIGGPKGAIIALLGAMLGRFSSIIVLVLVRPGVFETADLFMQVIGDTLGASLPPGSLLITALSMLFCGLFTLFGGLISSSLTKIAGISLGTRE